MMKTYPDLGETVFEKRLENGLLIRVVPKPGFAKKYAFLAVDYGSMDTKFSVNGAEFVSHQGVAHYLEHKMFDMPDCNVMQKFSCLGGNPNAFTSYDITAYFVECTDKFDENLRLLLQYVSTPYFTEESVEKERGIIAQEIRMYEDNPDSRVSENLFEIMYAEHPIRHSIAGTVESIGEITAKTLYDCYNSFYTPGNMMLCVVGDVEPDFVYSMAEELTARSAAASLPVRNYGAAEIMVPAQKRIEYEMEVSMPMFSVGFKAEPAKHGPDSMRQEVIGEIAAEILMGESSALYSRLYEKNLIDSGFSCGYDGLKGMSMISASGDSPEPDRVLEAILHEADRIAAEGADEQLFGRLKRSSLGRRIRELDTFDGICYKMCAYHFEGVDYFSFPEVFETISQEDVAKFLHKTVVEPRTAISIVKQKT